MKTRTLSLAGTLAVAFSAVAFAGLTGACDSTDVPKDAPKTDAGTTPGQDSGNVPGTDSGFPVDDAGKQLDCFPDPKTHLEIINRCSESQHIDKQSRPPGLLPDGGLPQLP